VDEFQLTSRSIDNRSPVPLRGDVPTGHRLTIRGLLALELEGTQMGDTFDTAAPDKHFGKGCDRKYLEAMP
jgi:hypothetical protein